MKGKPVAAAVFVVLIAVLLTIPLRQDDGSERADPEKTPEPTPTAAEADFPRTGVLGNDYPEGCLEQVTPEGDGLVAHYVPGGIAVVDLDGGDEIVIGDDQAFAWSPSGAYLGTDSGTIYESGGAIADNLPTRAATYHWGWSPIADCVLVADRRGILVVRPGSDTVRLVFKPVGRFAFSPSGGTLAYVREGRAGASIWRADLSTGKTDELVRLGTLDDEEVIPAGWAPDGSDLFYWVGPKTRLLDKGVRLRSVASDSETALPPVLARTDSVRACGDRTLAVAGAGARTEKFPKRLAFIETGSPEYLTSKDEWAISPACSPDGGSIAAVYSDDPLGGDGRSVALIDAAEGTAEPLVPSDSYSDAAPMWGEGEAGLLFVRVPNDGGPAELWHAPPDEEAQPTGITLDDVPGSPEGRRHSWSRFVDWSSDAPNGMSATEAGVIVSLP